VTTEIIAYIGAALMVVLAYLAYRYWRATAAFARRARESHAQRALESYQIAPLATPETPARETAPDAGPQASPKGVEAAGEDETGSATADQEPDEPDSAEQDPVDQEPAGPDSVEQDSVEEEPVDPGLVGGDDHAAGAPAEVEVLDPELRLIEELEPRPASIVVTSGREITEMLKQLDEEIAALPSGVELIDLPILERRRVADRRQELMNDRAHLLAQRKRGAHRRSRRPRKD